MLLTTGDKLRFEAGVDGIRVRGLPADAPDKTVPVVVVDIVGQPRLAAR
jgi:hypothetical protein